MLLLISPAKSLNFEDPSPPGLEVTQPRFQKRAAELIRTLKTLSSHDLAELMDLSESLADLNVARYRQWRQKPRAEAVRPAVFAFDGDVYGGLDARSLGARDHAWMQQHLRILSGLYGLLRPLDEIQAHRLEMGTRLATTTASNLYGFWGEAIAKAINDDLAAATGARAQPVVVNLASQEYFKSVRLAALQAPVVECVFEEGRGTGYKVISFMAKRARGLMARYIIQHRLSHADDLRAFDADGYAFAPHVSTDQRLVFRRQPSTA